MTNQIQKTGNKVDATTPMQSAGLNSNSTSNPVEIIVWQHEEWLYLGDYMGFSEQVSEVLLLGAIDCIDNYENEVPFEQCYKSLVAANMINDFEEKGCYDTKSSKIIADCCIDGQFKNIKFPNGNAVDLTSPCNGDSVSVGAIHIDKECFEKIIISGVWAVLREDLNSFNNLQTALAGYTIYYILRGNALDEAVDQAFKTIRSISHRMLAETLNSIETW